MVAAAVAGAAVVGGAYSANRQSSAARDASRAQSDAADAGVAEQRRQFDAMRRLMAPYVRAGTGALGQQQALIGLRGGEAQRLAIQALGNSPQMAAYMQQGENASLQNASATGGLRGGNTQGALAQFRPALLSQMIDQQYARLGGITSMGQNSAAGVGNAGMQTGSNIAALLQQQGSAMAGAQIAQGQAQAQIGNSIAGGIGMYAGMGGFGGMQPSQGGTYDYRGTVLPNSMRGGF